VTRPQLLVLVAGTATEVGKTWVGARTLEHLTARGVTVAARKPAQSFDPADPEPTDAEVLGAASGEDPATVCPAHRCYPVALAPPMAADVLGWPAPMIGDLIDELGWPEGPVAVGWLETVGGPRSPIADDADAVSLAGLVHPDLVVLVADAGLGTINAVLVSVAALVGLEVVVVLNRFDPTDDLHVRNLAWLRTREGLDVVTDAEALADVLVQRVS
jgi:dethiobiotin synthetase